MSSEFFTTTPLYSVRLKYLLMVKIVLRHLHQIQENWAGNSLRMQGCRDETEIYNYQRIQPSNNKFINA